MATARTPGCLTLPSPSIYLSLDRWSLVVTSLSSFAWQLPVLTFIYFLDLYAAGHPRAAHNIYNKTIAVKLENILKHHPKITTLKHLKNELKPAKTTNNHKDP